MKKKKEVKLDFLLFWRSGRDSNPSRLVQRRDEMTGMFRIAIGTNRLNDLFNCVAIFDGLKSKEPSDS